MSTSSRVPPLAGLLLFSLCAVPMARADYVDPPERVARLNDIQGDVSYSPAGEDEWVEGVRNRPLIRGDRLWTDRDARAELQVGSAALRLGSDTSVEILDLNDRIAQVQLTQGTISLRVRRLASGQTYEIATPTLAFTIDRIGRYRIDVDPDATRTTIVVWEGAGAAYGENASFPLRAGDAVRFYDTDLRDYELFGLPQDDSFDRYCAERDLRLNRSASLRYVGDDVVGYSDLDEYGSWSPVQSYGSVWFPSRVDADWAPYRDGHWVWQEPWGWTWVDDQPWGFAPSHYGRWTHVGNRWGWIPGPRNVRPIYAPALVAFIGGSNWSASISLGGRGSSVGWFPLGPREVYVPSYHASRDYFSRVNVNNTVINNTIITNVYNNYASGATNIKQAAYANRSVAGALTAVPNTVFVNAQPVRQSALRVDRNAATSGDLMRVAPVAPSERSVIGTGGAARARPAAEVFDRRVVARNAPPPGERPFAAREVQLQKNPGVAPEPRVGDQAQGRGNSANERVRVIAPQRAAVDARAAGSRRDGGEPGGQVAARGQLHQLDRTAVPEKPAAREPAERGRDQQRREPGAAQQQQPGQPQSPPENARPAAEQQRAERQRQAESQQQEQRQRKDEADKQAAEQQRAERQRQGEAQQQQQQQRQRSADAEKAAAQQQVERQRQVEGQQQQAGRQRQAQPQQQQPQPQQQNRGNRGDAAQKKPAQKKDGKKNKDDPNDPDNADPGADRG